MLSSSFFTKLFLMPSLKKFAAKLLKTPAVKAPTYGNGFLATSITFSLVFFLLIAPNPDKQLRCDLLSNSYL